MHSEPLSFSQTEILETQTINENIVHEHLTKSGSQSESRIGFILPTRAASYKYRQYG